MTDTLAAITEYYAPKQPKPESHEISLAASFMIGMRIFQENEKSRNSDNSFNGQVRRKNEQRSAVDERFEKQEQDEAGIALCSSIFVGVHDLIRKLTDRYSNYFHMANGVENRTVLMLGAWGGSQEVCEFSLLKRINCQAKDNYGMQALHYGVDKSQYQCVSYLIGKGGADPWARAKGIELQTPLSLAVSRGDFQMAEILIKKYPHILDPLNDPSLGSAVRFLLEGSYFWELETVRRGCGKQELLNTKCGLDLSPESRQTTDNYYHNLASGNAEKNKEPAKLETVEQLAKRQKEFRDIRKRERVERTYSNPKDGSLPFSLQHRVKHFGEGPYIPTKIFRGGGEEDNNQNRRTEEQNPLAPEYSYVEDRFPRLLEKCPCLATIKISNRERENITVLHLCARRRYAKCVRALLFDHSVADTTYTQHDGFLAIHEACAVGATGLALQALIEWHKEKSTHKHLNIRDKYLGLTPVLVAASRGHIGTVMMLREAGADMKAVSNAGYSIHHYLSINLGYQLTERELNTVYVLGMNTFPKDKETKIFDTGYDKRTKDANFSEIQLGVLKSVARDGFLDQLFRDAIGNAPRNKKKNNESAVQQVEEREEDEEDVYLDNDCICV